jgi:hypothetical protein
MTIIDCERLIQSKYDKIISLGKGGSHLIGREYLDSEITVYIREFRIRFDNSNQTIILRNIKRGTTISNILSEHRATGLWYKDEEYERNVRLEEIPFQDDDNLIILKFGTEINAGDWLLSIEYYTELSRIGFSGRYVLCEHKRTGSYVVMEKCNPNEVLVEAELRSLLRYACILEMKGYFLPGKTSESGIISEYVGGGSLSDVFQSIENVRDWWTPTQKVIVILGIVLGMKYIHSKDILHRDLRPENILFDDDRYVRIAGLRSSRLFDISSSMTRRGGSLYLAPELESGHYGKSADVYSFGLILFEILSGVRVCACSKSPKNTFIELREGWRPVIPEIISKVCRELIEKCWSEDVTSRPSFEEIWETIEGSEFILVDDIDRYEIDRFIQWTANRSHDIEFCEGSK